MSTIELSKYAIRTIWDDGDFVISQATPAEGMALLVVHPARSHPTSIDIVQLEQAFALRDELDIAWSARPFELVRHHGQPVLLMENPGGELLATILGKPWDLAQFLRVAAGLAASLGSLHERNLVHKNINPSNILVDSKTGAVWLMGFGIASRPTGERQTANTPSTIAGTLPYMAPEQSGRINRSLDLRSDLYAFGVILYEMLTGVLPFTASDPMEWIHCHVARHPVPACERVNGIPITISAIVSKLMSKNAEDRYQTARGVESDLRRCLEDWELNERLDPFSLAARDIPNRILIPERLYGREREIDTLLAAYSRVRTCGTPQVVLISGYSGMGKSSVVSELDKALISSNGLFASGKVDQYQRDIPYATLGHAFRSLVLRILSQSDKQLSEWRTVLQDAIGTNGQLIVNLIPEIELVIGKQLPILDIPVKDAQNRFQTVFRRFLCAFARSEHPLVLFLDDLQWMDTTTLNLVEFLVSDPQTKYLLFIGAYRSNEISSSDPFIRTITGIREAGLAVEEIALEALALDKIGELITDTLHCEIERATLLTGLIYEKTGGNPFFVIQFLSALAEENLIEFDSKAAAWAWDLDGIRAKNHTDNIVDLMIRKLNRLPGITREILKQLACLGNSAGRATLTVVLQLADDKIRSALREAVNAGLISSHENTYSFLHDRIQEAAYELVPEENRAEVHLRIGRLLAENLSAEKQREMIFVIVNQLNRGAALITSLAERESVARLNLEAANRAKTATAYYSALSYLATANSFLAAGRWEICHELIFAVELHRAECEFITGQLTSAEDRLSALASRSAMLADRAAVTRLRVALYTTVDRSDRAVKIGLEYLQSVGIEWSAHPTDEDVRQEYELMKQLLGERQIDELHDLPLMEDPDWRTTMEVIAEIITPARFTNENLHHAVLLRITNFSLKYGNCNGSCYAYSCLNIVVGHRFRDYDAGFRFGKLGVELVERRGLDRFKARAFMCFGSLVMPWTHHVLSAQCWIRQAFETANEMGDLTFAAYSSKNIVTNLFVSGVPLGEVQREAENSLAFCRKAQFGFVADCFNWQLKLIRSLRGLTHTFPTINDERRDEISFEQRLASNPKLSFPECCNWLYKIQKHYFAGDYLAALKAADETESLLWTIVSLLEIAEFHFYVALAYAAACHTAPADQRQVYLDKLTNHFNEILVWAKNCPANFECRVALIAAEIARLDERQLDAEQLYEKAIRLGHEGGFVQHEALAHELAARFYRARGFETISNGYLQNARTCYLQWGADGKVQELDRIHPHLRARLPAVASSTIRTPIESLDLTTIVKASQAVSEEIVLGNLIQTLMKIAMEHAGAERALLILRHGDELQIQAEATIDKEGGAVHLVAKTPTSADLPESILKYVVRTRETVILDDALGPNLFSTDDYLAQKRARSILCLPLVKQGMVVGVLHLENSTTSHAFTPDRVEVLKLLASQAAISIENARLYTDLKESEDRLRFVIDSIPEMVWSNLPDGSNDFANRRWQEYTGLSGQEASGLGWTSAIHPDDLSGLLEAQRIAYAGGVRYMQEIRMRRADGEYRYFLAQALPLRDEAGKIVKWYGTNIDIEDRRRAVETLQTAFEEIKELKDKLYRENIALKDEINRSSMFEEIIGTSPVQRRVLNLVARVAPTDSTVLITGETGTGKELIARAIHKASPRAERAFVSVNCAAIPQSLIASELFGHEKGAFTGAHQRHLGRFELADGGTILLDEVGELPMETQISLLRVLQEREFERVGGSKSVRTHVRIIAATNRNLEAAIADGTFRSDLFYRLNVLPIELPPLRERKEDIPMLVEYFIDRFARKMRKKIRNIQKTTMDRLVSYAWPGNIRELQNVIERSLIVCETETLAIDESWLASSHPTLLIHTPPPGQMLSKKAREKQTIEAALAESEGRVSGPSGAAIKLGMAPSTLDYKIRNLKINKNQFKAI